MKIKTFILTFLMMMSSPFLFGQNHWVPDELYYSGTMQFTSKIYLDGEQQTNTDYEVAAFHGEELLAVSNILKIGTDPNPLFHVDLNVKGNDDFGMIYFKLFDGSKEYVSVEEIQFVNESSTGGSHITPSEINFKSVAQIEGTEYDVVYPSLQEAYNDAAEDQTITLLNDITLSEIFVIAKSITLDGNGKTLTSSAGRAINVSGANGVTIKKLTINASGERAINVIQNATNVTIDNVTATAANYTVNVAASAGTAKVAISNSNLTGLNVVNVGAPGSEITINGGTITCNDQNANENYAALALNKDAVGAKIAATGVTFDIKGDSKKAKNGAEDGVITIDGKTDEVAVVVAYIDNGGNYYYAYTSIEDAIKAAKAGETITLLRDITASDIVTINKAITLDGNGKKLTSTAGRAINVSGADGVTIKNLTINASGERAINVIQNATNVTIDNVTATAANYTVNVAASATAAVVAIKNSTLNGLCTVSVSAAGADVTIDNSTVNCNDNNTTVGEAYAALSLNKEAVGGSIVATNTTVNVTDGSDSMKGRNSAENGTVSINGSTDDVTVMVAVITYEGSTYYYSFETLAAAVEYAKTGDVVTLIRDITASDILTINKAITLDGNGKKLTSTAGRAINVSGAEANGVKIQNLTINASGERAINVIQNATNVTIDNVTATAANYTVNVAASATAAVVAIKNSTLNGLCTVSVSAAGADVTIDNSTVNCNDNNTTVGEAYAALSLNKEAVGGSIVATNTTVNVTDGSDSMKGRNSAENGTVSINGSTDDVTVMVAVITYEGSPNYYSFETLAAAVEYAKADDVVTLLRDVTVAEKITIAKSITLDGNGKTITYTGNGASARAIDVPATEDAELDVTIKNLTVDCTSSYCQRGINYNDDGKLTLEGVTVKGTNVTYALNLPGSSDNCKVAINNSSLTGNIALNVWGAYAIINATDSHFTSVDNATHENYAAVKLNNNGTDSAEDAVITITGGSITAKDENEQPSSATTNATATGVINISETTEVIGNIETIVAIVTYEGASEFYGCFTLQEAIDKAGDDNRATVKLLSDVTLSEKVEVNKSVVLDLNDKKVTSTAQKAFEVHADATIKNGAIEAAQRCVDTRTAVELTLTDVELVAKSTTYGNPQVLTIGGYDNGTEVTMENVEINAGTAGYGIITFVETKLTATESAISGYSALYVKPGSDNSEFNFVNSDLSGTIGNDVEGNSFSTIAVRANNVAVNVDAESTVTANGDHYFAISFIGKSENTTTGSSVTVAGEITGNILDAPNGNTVKVKAEYADELAAAGYATIEAENGLVAVIKAVAKITETGDIYGTLTAAITAAQPGNTIFLLADITEDVTINKNLTIDGGDNNYTGTMTGNKGITLTVMNVDFVNAGFEKPKAQSSTTGDYTFNNCTFDGSDNYPYAFSVRGAKTITIEDCTVKDYMYGFLYTPSATLNVTVKNVTVENCPNYGVYFASGVTNTSIENLTVKNSGSGIVYNNTASRKFTLKNCKFENVTTAINHAGNGTNTVTCNLLGENDFGTSALSQYAKVVLTEADATLTAQENLNVTTSVEGSIVKYEESKYVVKGAIAKIGDEIYASLQEAINAAVDNNVIEVLQDINLADVELQKLEDSYDTYFLVEGKKVTINLNGKTISGEYTGSMLVGVFSTDKNGELTLTGNGTVDVTTNTKVYTLITAFNDGSKVTIEDGTYKLNKASDALIYYGGKTDKAVTVNGGTFTLGNVGEGENGKPWIFNVLGAGDHHVYVTGGTFNFDINRQHWSNEAIVAETHYTVNNGDGTYTVKDGAEAYVNTGMTTGPYFAPKNIGYATLAEALAKAQEFVDPNVTLLQVVELAETLTIEAGKEIILDLNGKTITGKDNNTSGSFNLFVNKGTFEVKDGSAEGTGKITLEATTNRYWNASSSIVSNSAGTLTITSGTLEHLGGTDMAYGIDNNSTLGLTTLNVDGGKIASPYRAIRQFQNSLQDNVVVVNGGTISARAGIWMQQPSTNDKAQLGTLEVNGGNFECIANAIVIDIQGSAKSNVTINGGTFSNTSETANLLLIWPFSNMNVVNDNCSAVMNITGGNFTCAGEGNLIGILDGADTNGDVILTGGIYSEDVNAYCAEGFAAVNNGDGTWTVMPAQEQYLGHGFNWYSSYLYITTNDLLSALGESGKTVVLNGSWSATYFEDEDFIGWDYDTHELDFSKMYMIETKQEHTLKLTGELLNAGNIDINIEKGWNWIGYPSNEKVEINTALKNLQATEGDRIVGQSGFADYAPIYGGWVGSLKYLEPTKGYQYNSKNVSEDGVKFNYNIAPATTRGNNETVVATHYSVDYTKYPFNMTMVAVVDGAMDDNYEVAALVNGEVRGSARPVYIEVLDAYMLFLTISGDNVEEVSFKYYDLTTGEEYDLVNRIDYSNNAMVGSVNEPYVLSRGTTGIGDAAMSQVNIYPNPTTTGTEINLEAVCDTVEVFNALGIKVAEYQNVDSIDALETAGIYVIRITNDGNVQNCRLVVK